MMPRWLQGLTALASGIVVALGIIAGLALWATVVQRGEPSFSNEQRAFLQEQYPNGTFISDKTFRWCEARVFFYVDAAQRTWNNGESCMSDLPRR